MKYPVLLFSFIIICLLTVFINKAVAGDDKAPVLVNSQWLAEHLNDPNLVVLNVAQNARAYRNGHIPGARFLWVTNIAASNPELTFQLVPVEQLDTLLEGLGISNDSRVILCGVNGNVSPTARAYITLEYVGMGDRTSILDGGVEAWKTAGHTVSKETPTYKRGSFTPKLKRDAIVDVEYVKSRKDEKGVAVLDARAPEYYNGIGGGFPHPGRIPGARNLFFNTLFDTSNQYLPLDSLRAKFDAAGIKPGDEIITYCHIGQTASSDYVAAKILGHTVHLYDGSFEDWSGREELPVYVEPKKDPEKK